MLAHLRLFFPPSLLFSLSLSLALERDYSCVPAGNSILLLYGDLSNRSNPTITVNTFFLSNEPHYIQFLSYINS